MLAIKRPRPQPSHCRIYWALLFLCYLEVLLWTSCLFISCVPNSAATDFTDSHNYLIREKGNLGFATGGGALARAVVASPFQIPPAVVDQHLKSCWTGISRGLQLSLILVNFDLLQPALATLRIFEESSGLPAPYTGIKAIS